MSNVEKHPGALDGIRVIDLSSVLMGPLACRMLADHGVGGCNRDGWHIP